MLVVNCVYVGETGCKVRERMNQHRFDISRHNDTPVAAHFSLPGHNLHADFSTAVHTGQHDHEAPNREDMDFTH